eukprot:m.11452 g.11452  ORF g.11452 m.11452 type:complete len:86 (-) comp8811_c1_seq1:368-625(-)
MATVLVLGVQPLLIAILFAIVDVANAESYGALQGLGIVIFVAILAVCLCGVAVWVIYRAMTLGKRKGIKRQRERDQKRARLVEEA